MMNFDQIIERRGTSCVKWDKEPGGVLPLWVADMDFPCPDEVVRAVRERAAHPVYGYSFPGDSCYEAIIEKLERDYGWRVKKEWIVFSSGVVEGLHGAIRAVSRPGDNILLQEPVYSPFFRSITDAGCQIRSNSLTLTERGFRMDTDDMSAKCDARTKAVMLCSPHNPGGRVWTRAELEAFAEVCVRKDLVVIADEIHCDIVFKPNRHTAFATLSEEIADRTITFMAPSKTFNLAGLCAAFAIIPNAKLRRAFEQAQMHHGVNLFGYVALEAAYRHGGAYLAEMLAYTEDNIDAFIDKIHKNLPMLHAYKPEGTYLIWLDMRKLGMPGPELDHFILDKCRLHLVGGTSFGAGGEGFQRVNAACPRAILNEAADRLIAQVTAISR